MKNFTANILVNSPFLWIMYGILLIFYAKYWNFDGLYGQDAYEYYRCYCELGHDQSCLFPIQYPIWAKSLGVFFSARNALQLWAIFSAAATLYYVEKFLRLFSENHTQIRLFVVVFGASSLYFLRLSLCVMSDTTAIFFSIAGIYHSYCYVDRAGKKIDLALGLLLSLNALLTRYAAIFIIAWPSLISLYVAFKRKEAKVLLLTFFAALFFIGLSFFLKNNYFSSAGQHSLLVHWSWQQMIGQQFTNAGDGSGSYALPNFVFYLLFFLHPAYIAWGSLFSIAALFVFRSISQRQFLFLFAPAICYWFFLTGTYHQGTRLLLLIFPHLLIFYFPAFQWIVEKCKPYFSKKALIVMLLFTGIMQWMLFPFATKKMRHWNQVETQIAQRLKQQLPPDATIYTLGMEGVLFAHKLPQKTVSLYGDTLKSIDKEAFILIQTEVFAKQWANLLPEKNLQFLQKQCPFTVKDSFDLGWKLYHATER